MYTLTEVEFKNLKESAHLDMKSDEVLDRIIGATELKLLEKMLKFS